MITGKPVDDVCAVTHVNQRIRRRAPLHLPWTVLFPRVFVRAEFAIRRRLRRGLVALRALGVHSVCPELLAAKVDRLRSRHAWRRSDTCSVLASLPVRVVVRLCKCADCEASKPQDYGAEGAFHRAWILSHH